MADEAESSSRDEMERVLRDALAAAREASEIRELISGAGRHAPEGEALVIALAKYDAAAETYSRAFTTYYGFLLNGKLPEIT